MFSVTAREKLRSMKGEKRQTYPLRIREHSHSLRLCTPQLDKLCKSWFNQ